MGFGLLAIMHLFPLGLKASKISEDVTTATFLAQERIELLKSTKYSKIVTDDTGGSFAAPFDEFSWKQKVSDVKTINYGLLGSVVWLKKVTVRVSWDRYGRTRNVKLVTYLANYKKVFPL
jgi:hypothetical protein